MMRLKYVNTLSTHSLDLLKCVDYYQRLFADVKEY